MSVSVLLHLTKSKKKVFFYTVTKIPCKLEFLFSIYQIRITLKLFHYREFKYM